MTDEQLKQLITIELDKQALEDLKAIMVTPHGRRFFCWLIMQCGQNSTSFTRDSRTYFNEGMRNIALILEGSMKALGLDGVDLMHKAEREYIVHQERIKNEIKAKTKG
jgi:hypothetical protein